MILRQTDSSSIRFPVQPRDVPAVKAARRLHLTLGEFQARLPRLIQRGFPRPDPDTGNFDLKAIDAWMDQRSGLSSPDRLTGDVSASDARDLVSERLARRGWGK